MGSERKAADEVREVCSFVGLYGVCFGLQSIWKRLQAKPQTFMVGFLRVYPVSKTHEAHRAKICQFNVLTEQEHCV